jgi:arginine:ornithine antiporter/lysine permease
MSASSTEKLSLSALTALVVGSMVGAGIFLLPRTFAGATGPLGAIIAWCIAGIGMYLLARVFQVLAVRKPHLESGIYAYPRAGFGPYLGFLSAFGYWIGTCIGNVAYWALVAATLAALFPVLGDNAIITIAVASIGIWCVHFLILLGGVPRAAVVNTILTIIKIIPIVLVILLLLVAFKLDLFRANFWGGADMPTTSLYQQVRAALLATVFVFLGIEAASVYSRRAKDSDVGTATILGFFSAFVLMVLVSMLSYAVLARAELAGMPQPSLASVLDAAVGPWGAVFVAIALLLAVVGACLAWTLLSIEVLFVTSESGDAPSLFAKENSDGVPVAALWTTNIVVQLFLISTYWSQEAFTLMANLTSTMALIPYFLVAAYGFMIARRGETYDTQPQGRSRDLIVAGLAALYTIFLIFTGGLKFLLLSAILYALGTFLYLVARREQGKPLFTPAEWAVLAVIVAGCIAGVYALTNGVISI